MSTQNTSRETGAYSGAPLGGGEADYAEQVIDLLAILFSEVICGRNPEIDPILKGDQAIPADDRNILLRTLQAHGIWFRLHRHADPLIVLRPLDATLQLLEGA